MRQKSPKSTSLEGCQQSARLTSMVGSLLLLLTLTSEHGHHNHEHHDSSHHSMSYAADHMSALPYTAVCVANVGYPLFKLQSSANSASSVGTSHSHSTGGYTLYMPNGDYPGKIMCSEECACPPPGAAAGAIDATKIIMLPKSAFCMQGNYPLYATKALAETASPDSTSHSHKFAASDGAEYTFYMPDGVAMIHGETCGADQNDQTGVLAAATTDADGTAITIGAAVGGSAGGLLLIAGVAACLKFKVFRKEGGETSRPVQKPPSDQSAATA